MFKLDLRHFSSRTDGKEIYTPSEDTYTLIDALQLDLAYIKSRSPLICVEVGSGSGAVLASLAHMLGPEVVYIAVDINAKATEMTHLTLERNNVRYGEVIRMDLVMALRLEVDLVVCNPPYVVTTEEEYRTGQRERDIVAAYAGGPRGRNVVDRLKAMLEEGQRRILWYMLLVQENCPREVGEEVYRRVIRGETQVVVRGSY